MKLGEKMVNASMYIQIMKGARARSGKNPFLLKPVADIDQFLQGLRLCSGCPHVVPDAGHGRDKNQCLFNELDDLAIFEFSVCGFNRFKPEPEVPNRQES